MRRSNSFIAILFLVAAALLFLYGLTAFEPLVREDGAVNATADTTPLEVPRVDFGNPQLGPADAAVTIVEFGDYGCAPCADMADDLARLVADYAGKVRLVWKDFPNLTAHPDAGFAAEAARCAGIQGAYWEYHDLLLANIGVTGTDGYVTLASTLGLDGQSLRTCLDERATSAAVQRDFEEGLRLRLDGTPYLFLNGRRVSGAVDYDQLKTLVDAELAK